MTAGGRGCGLSQMRLGNPAQMHMHTYSRLSPLVEICNNRSAKHTVVSVHDHVDVGESRCSPCEKLENITIGTEIAASRIARVADEINCVITIWLRAMDRARVPHKQIAPLRLAHHRAASCVTRLPVHRLLVVISEEHRVGCRN